MALEDHDDYDDIPAGGKGLRSLPDGDLLLEIDSAEFKETQDGRDIVKLKVIVLNEGKHKGMTFDHDYWLKKKDKDTKEIVVDERKVGTLRKDLKTLGFDEVDWTKAAGRPFKAELQKALLVMPGIQIKAKKSTKDEYANLYINGRGEDGKPEKFGPAELAAAAKADEAPFSVD